MVIGRGQHTFGIELIVFEDNWGVNSQIDGSQSEYLIEQKTKMIFLMLVFKRFAKGSGIICRAFTFVLLSLTKRETDWLRKDCNTQGKLVSKVYNKFGWMIIS